MWHDWRGADRDKDLRVRAFAALGAHPNKISTTRGVHSDATFCITTAQTDATLAVCFNCYINLWTSARFDNDGRVERL